MKAFLEREIKLTPPAGLDLAVLGGDAAAPREFESVYYDTERRELLRHRVTLRRRVEGGRAAWQLKLPGADGRHELEFGGGDDPPDEALALLHGLTRGTPLVPLARLRTHRETVRIGSGDAHLADVALDSVTVLDDEVVVGAFDEVEVELVDGTEADLRRLERMLRAAGAADAGGPSKLVRALGAVPREERLPESAAPADVLAGAIATQLQRMLDHDPGTRTGLDAEDLHQFRVAIRRLRAFLREASALVDRAWADEVRAELGWLGQTLGAVRDLDVLIERFRAEAAELDSADRESLEPFFGALDAERESARLVLLGALASDRYLALLARLEADVPVVAGIEHTLAAIWLKAYRRAERAVSSLAGEPPDDELHAARIAVKRARYAAELAAPELGKRGAAFVEAAKEFQDVVGAHQDAVVGEAVLRRLAPELPGAALAIGRLVDREQARRAKARAVWRRAWRTLARRARALGA